MSKGVVCFAIARFIFKTLLTFLDPDFPHTILHIKIIGLAYDIASMLQRKSFYRLFLPCMLLC